MKILFWVPYSTEGPSNRFRVEQYLSYLDGRDISYTLCPFWSREVYKILYARGHYFKKIYYFLKGALSRFCDLLSLSDYDIIFIHREAFPLGGALLERLSSLCKPIIYDFDDSVFLPNSSEANKLFNFLKSYKKTVIIAKISKIVIAGNNYLKECISSYNKNVIVIATPIDTKLYAFCPIKRHVNKVIIGWIGTHSTSQYLLILEKVFSRLIDKYKKDIEIRLIGCKKDYLSVRGIRYINWELSREVQDLQDLDVGVMPMWEDEWTKGKCAFKIIQYMATGVAVVASPVGMNKEIVIDGGNGFLAENENEWFNKLCILVEQPKKRFLFAEKGRRTIENEYSLAVMVPQFMDVLERVYSDRNK